jgi:hypothetical protein
MNNDFFKKFKQWLESELGQKLDIKNPKEEEKEEKIDEKSSNKKN